MRPVIEPTMAAYTLLYDAEGGVQAVDFDDDYLAFKAKPGHRACLGRGYRLFHNPGQPPFKVVCACAAKRI